MFKNVLVGVDGRQGGRDAIALARLLSEPDGKLTLAFVRSNDLAEDLAQSNELLERERGEAVVEAELVSVVSANPGRGLHERAERQGADLLVVGSCSHGTFGRAMLGDDTRAALNGAPCAVAVGARGLAEHPSSIAKLGVAYNGSPESAAALSLARELAAPSGSELHALEVVSLPAAAYGALMAPPTWEFVKGMVQAGTDRMNQLVGVEGRAVYGIPGEELARFGDEVDILVVGSRGYGPVRRIVSGSTSDYLQRHARCSLLVLPRVDEGSGS